MKYNPEKVKKHGEQLLVIFPKAKIQDPVLLYQHLLRLQTSAEQITLRLCNGPEYSQGPDYVDKLLDKILQKVEDLLQAKQSGVNVFINRDPRGYALKIEDTDMIGRVLHKDWGGYGILAPELK